MENELNNKIVGEFRSRDHSIVHIAKKYGGGGHKFASGATVSSLDIVKDLIKEFNQLSREIKDRKVQEKLDNIKQDF